MSMLNVLFTFIHIYVLLCGLKSITHVNSLLNYRKGGTMLYYENIHNFLTLLWNVLTL